MKTVHDLDEDEFLERFNRDMDLDEIFGDVRIEREGIEILIEPDGEHYVSVDNAEPTRIYPVAALTLGLLIGLGYVSTEESVEKLEVTIGTLRVHISNIRQQVGANRIQTRKGDYFGPCGYYLENVASCRPKHWKSWKGYRINTKTGCFIMPNDGKIILNGSETKFMEHLVDGEGCAHIDMLIESFYDVIANDTYDRIHVIKSILDRKLRKTFELGDEVIYLLFDTHYRLRVFEGK